MKRMRLRTLSLFFAAVLTLTAITGSYGSVPVNAGEEEAIMVNSESGDDSDADTDSGDKKDESDPGESKDDGDSGNGGDSGDDSHDDDDDQDDSGQNDNDDDDDQKDDGGEQDPSAPADPAAPSDPAAPADPSQPTDPAAPADPSQPTDPAAPVDPSQPTDPAAPVDPSQPTDPAAPADPSQPTDPAAPVDPAQPTEPVADPGEADPTEAAPTDEADPTIQNPTDNLPVEAEPTEEEEEEVEFDETIVADGVTIRIQADKGVFPEGTYFEADKVTDSGKIETIENTIENTSGKEVNKSVTFDIKTYDKEHNRIQPDTSKGKVRVTFGNIDCDDDQTLEAFYVSDNLKSATKVGSADKGDKEVDFNAKHFSLYTTGAMNATGNGNGHEERHFKMKVVDQDNNPIVGAVVIITRDHGNGTTETSGQTDNNGVVDGLTYKTGDKATAKVVLNGVVLVDGAHYPTNDAFNQGHDPFDLTGNPLVINLHYDTIKYHNNAPEGRTVTGTMVDQVIYAGSKEKLTKNAFEIKGFKFIGWSGSADGSVEYEDEYEYECKSETQNKELNLYAQWLPDTNGIDSATAYLVAPWANNGGGKFDIEDKTDGVTSNKVECFIPIGVPKSGSIDNYVNTYYSQYVRKSHADFDSHVKFGAFLADFEKEMHGFKVIVKDGTITVVNKEYSYSSTLDEITWYVAKKESSDYNKVGWHVDGFTTWNKVDAAYKVTFHSNGGTPVAQKTVSYNGKVTKPENPTKNNNKFEGWFRDEACTTEYDFDSKVIGDLDLYAGWTEEQTFKIKVYDDDTNTLITEDSPVSYKLKLDDEEISEVSANGITVSNGTKYCITDIEITDPYKYSGYQVDGGSVDTSNPDAITGTVIADTEVVIHVSRLKVTVSFDAVGGNPVPDTQVIDKGTKAEEPEEIPEKQYLAFDGWYTSQGEKYDFDTEVNENLTLYAHYKASDDSADYDKATVYILVPGKTKTQENTLGRYEPGEVIGNPTENYICIADAKVSKYITENYDSYALDDVSDYVTNYKAKGNSRYTSGVPYTINTVNGRKIVEIVIDTDGDNEPELWETDITDKLSVKDYYVIKTPSRRRTAWHVDAEANWRRRSAEDGIKTIVISANSAQTTYNGEEQSVEGFEAYFEGQKLEYKPKSGNFVAGWEFTVQYESGPQTYRLQDGSVTAKTSGTEVGTYADTEWSFGTNPKLGKPYIKGNSGYIHSDKFKFVYINGTLEIKPREYTVSFNTFGGIPAPEHQLVPEGSAATRPAVEPKKNGHVFKDWYENEECTTLYDFSSPITKDTLIFAGYEPDTSIEVNSATTFIQIPGASEVPEKTIEFGSGQSVGSYGDSGYLKLGSAKLTKYVTDQYVSYAESDIAAHVLDHKFISTGKHEYAGHTYWLKSDGTKYIVETTIKGTTWIGDLSTLKWYVIKNYKNSTDVKTWHVDGRVNWTQVDPDKRILNVSANSLKVKYNGEEQSVEGFEKTEFVIDGEKYTVSGMNAKASGTEAGVYLSEITYTTASQKPVVYDSYGNDVSLQFTVNVIPGQLTIERNEGGIEITGESVNGEYNGESWKIKPVKVSGITGDYIVVYSIESVSGNNDAGDAGRQSRVSSRTSAHTDELTVDEGEYLYEDLPSYTDVTEVGFIAKVKSNNYENIHPYHIQLRITPRKTNANSEGATKVYDGKALTNGNDVKIDNLVAGETPAIKITGSQLHAGSSKNTFELSNSGKFKTTNYDITNNYGTLTVTPAPVSISAKSYTKTKGDADPAFEADVAGNIYNNEVTWSLARESGEAVGTYAINVSFVGTNDYSVATKAGILTIKRRGGGGGGGNTPSTPSTPGTPGGPGTPGSPILMTVPAFADMTIPGGVLGTVAGPAGGLTPAAIAGGLLDLDGEVLGIRDQPMAVSEDAAPDDIGDEPDLISDVLGVREDACWIHWLILILTVIYALYNTIRIGARHHLIKKLDDDETENTQES